jgi:heme-degrading monooxygenase HmoA
MEGPTKTSKSPYYAVIFTSLRTAADNPGYEKTADRMVELASMRPGFLGVESARGDDGVGITISYWTSLEAIRSWREHFEHRVAQELGREKWYQWYQLRIAALKGRSASSAARKRPCLLADTRSPQYSSVSYPRS